jgi:hypothetical protein
MSVAMKSRLPTAGVIALSAVICLGLAPARAGDSNDLSDLLRREGIHWPGEGGKKVEVSLGIVVVEFARINLREESFEMAGYLDTSWTDPSLALKTDEKQVPSKAVPTRPGLGSGARVRERCGTGRGRARGGPLRHPRGTGDATRPLQP